MMDQFLNTARGEMERVASRIANLRMAYVSSYDPSTYAVKVRLQPEDVETGWAPLLAVGVGNGFGLLSPPNPGDAVLVGFQEGNGGVPVVLGGLFNDTDRPDVQGAGTAPSGDKWLVHKNGTRIRLYQQGVEIFGKAGTKVTLNLNSGEVDIHGPVVRIGAEGSTFRRLLDERFHAWATTHVHSNTGPPTAPPPLPASATLNLVGA